MSENVKMVISTAIGTAIGGIAFSVFYFATDVLVDRFIFPKVKNKLVAQEIFEEKVTGNPIHPDTIKKLKDLENKTQEVKESMGNHVDAIESRLSKIEDINAVWPDKLINIQLYRSERNEDKDQLVLNGENHVIAHWLKNGCAYRLTARDKTLPLKSRFDHGVLDDKGEKTTEPIGRLHNEQFDQLYKGSKWRGLGRAQIQLHSVSCDE